MAEIDYDFEDWKEAYTKASLRLMEGYDRLRDFAWNTYCEESREEFKRTNAQTLYLLARVELIAGYAEERRMKNVINFYSSRDEHGYMSNFAPFPVVMNKKRYTTSEHYYQSQKFAGTNWETKVRKAKSPMEAATLGRRKDGPLRRDWESIKDNVMREVVLAKFRQYPELARLLLETGDAKLIEHTSNDSYWADGGDGTGKNMLGIILMEIREVLHVEAANRLQR